MYAVMRLWFHQSGSGCGCCQKNVKYYTWKQKYFETIHVRHLSSQHRPCTHKQKKWFSCSLFHDKHHSPFLSQNAPTPKTLSSHKNVSWYNNNNMPLNTWEICACLWSVPLQQSHKNLYDQMFWQPDPGLYRLFVMKFQDFSRIKCGPCQGPLCNRNYKQL